MLRLRLHPLIRTFLKQFYFLLISKCIHPPCTIPNSVTHIANLHWFGKLGLRCSWLISTAVKVQVHDPVQEKVFHHMFWPDVFKYRQVYIWRHGNKGKSKLREVRWIVEEVRQLEFAQLLHLSWITSFSALAALSKNTPLW